MEKKKAIMRKVLSCLVVIAILTSTVPGTVFAMDSSVSATEASSNDNFLEEAHTENNSAENAINTKNNIAIARKTDDYPGTEKGEVLFRGEASIYWFDFWGGINWEGYEVNINQILYDPNNYLQNTPSIWVIQPAWSYPRMDSVSSGTLVEVYGQYVVVEIDGSIYGEIHLCEPDEEYGTIDYFLRDITQSETYESTGTVTGVPKNPSRAGFYSLDLDDVDYGWNWYGEVYFSKTSNGPQVDNVAVGDAVEICGNRYYYNDGRAIIDLITSDHYLKKKDSEPTQFYIRPACQDVNGNHLDDVSYEFVDYPTYKGTCDYSGYLLAPGHGTYNVKFTKGDLEATVTLESHLKPFAGTVVTLRKKEGSIYATSTPSGANVYLDGSYKGTSPITILNVPVGSHTVKYTKTGYKDCVKTVTVYANQQRNVHCYMEEEKFYIRPACQDVNGNHLDEVGYEFVDYPTYKGTCDYSGYLLAPGHGTYMVKFTKGNLEATVTLESHLKPFAGTVVTLRKKEGSIYATSTPSGANVYLDGSYKGTSPLTISNVPVGSYTAKYTKTGYKDCEKTVTVYANQQRNVHCDLVPISQTGSIYATSTPSGANVYLDGTYKGVSLITISNVPVGTHTVKFAKTGYKDCEKTVTVYANQQTNVHCDQEASEISIILKPPFDDAKPWKKLGEENSVSTSTAIVDAYSGVAKLYTSTTLKPGRSHGYAEADGIFRKSFYIPKNGWYKIDVSCAANGKIGGRDLSFIEFVVSYCYSKMGIFWGIKKEDGSYVIPLSNQYFDTTVKTKELITDSIFNIIGGLANKIVPFAWQLIQPLLTPNERAIKIPGYINDTSVQYLEEGHYTFEVEVATGVHGMLFAAFGCPTIYTDFGTEDNYIALREVRIERILGTSNAAPRAIFTPLEAKGEINKGIRFDGTRSKDTDGEITDYYWEFENGNPSSFNYAYPYVKWHEPGTYQIKFKVKDNRGTWSKYVYGRVAIEDPTRYENKDIIKLDCPINATITDQYGRIIADDGTNEIPDASMIITKEMKIFYLPADLRYSVDIDAYGSGTFNLTRVSPIGTDISITKFENIPVTSNTKASVEIEPGVTDYTMSVDYNGDGVTDEEKSPDVSETIEVTTPTNIIYVPDDYPMIQAAVDAASPGDTIIVRDEVFTENIDVNKPLLTIRSENGAENCIVQTANSKDHVFEVKSDHVNISGFTVEGAGVIGGYTKDGRPIPSYTKAGIYISNVDHFNISNNKVSRNWWGIAIEESSSNGNIISNIIVANYYSGICLYSENPLSLNNNIINYNNVLNNYVGIFVKGSNSNKIYLNNFINNTNNVCSSSTTLWNSPSKITYTYNGNAYTSFLGNYWDDCTGSDVNGDGIGDTAHSIDSDKDNYPLMQPWEKYFGVHGGIGISVKPNEVGVGRYSTVTYSIVIYNWLNRDDYIDVEVIPRSCKKGWFSWVNQKHIYIKEDATTEIPLSVTPTEVGNFKFEVKANVESNPNIYASQEGNINVVKAGGVDTTSPEITIISPEEGVTYATTEIAMEVTANEPISKWSYNLNGAGNVPFTPNITTTAREGDNSLVVFAEDSAGNIGCSEVSFRVGASSVTFIDSAGRTVTVSKPIEGIVVLNSDAAEAIQILGAADKVVGVSEDVYNKSYYFPELSKKQIVKKGNTPDYEVIMVLKPDIVITYVDSISEVEEKLKSLGITAVALDFYKRDTMGAEIEKLGYILDKKDRAKEYNEWCKKYEDKIKSLVDKLSEKEKPGVFIETTYKGLSAGIGTCGPGSTEDNFCTMAGGINIAGDLTKAYPYVDYEWVLVKNPDVMIKCPYPMDWGWETTDEPENEIEAIKNRPGAESIEAVKNNCIYVSSYEFRYGMDCIVGLAYWAKLLHPEFDLYPKGIYKEYLEYFLDLEYPEDLIFVYPE